MMRRGWVMERYLGLVMVLIFFPVVPNAAGDILLDGLIEPKEIADLSSQTPGILDTVFVDRGSRVLAGQELARLKAGPERITVEQARARLEFARRKAERSEDLFKKDLLSRHDRDEMETEILLNKLQFDEAAERLEMRTIRSPFPGVVVKRTLSPGEYVGTEPILTVARVDTLHIEVIAPVEHLGAITVGTRAEIRPEAPVGGVYAARVVLVDRVIDAASGTFGVRLELPNPSYRLPAGLKCSVRFIAK